MGQATSNQVHNNPEGGDEEVAAIDSRLLEFRHNFMKAVQKGEEYTHFVKSLISLPCPVSLKYAVLNVKHILEQNNQSEEELKKIPIALGILEKYCRHLLKPVSLRAEMWRSVKYSNPIYRDRVEPLKGSTDVMELMGYSVKVEDGIYFPEGKEPDMELTRNLLTDIIMARQEMELYLIGAHPQPAHIDQYLPQNTIILQQSGYETSSTSPRNITSKTGGEMKNKGCTICLDKKAVIFCEGCDNILMCEMCDSKWHEHPRRQQPNHKRKKIEAWNVIPQSSVTIAHQGAYGLGLLSVNDRIIPKSFTIAQEVRPPPVHKVNIPKFNTFVSQEKEDNRMESTQINEPFARTKTINEELDAHRSKLNIYSIQSQNLKPGNKVDYAKKLTAGTDTTQNLPKVPLMPPINATPVETNLNETASQISFSRSKGNLTSSLSLSQGASKVMSEIMSIQDIDKRKSTCEKSLEFLEDDILNLDQLINDILTKNDEFLKNEDFAVLNQKKSTLIKDKIMLDQYYKRLKLGTTQSMNLSEIVLYHSDIDETRQTESRMTTNLSKQFKSLQSHDIKPPLSHTVPVANNSPRTGHGIIPNISVSQQTNISSHMIETFPTTVLTNYGSMWSCQHCTYYNNVETRVCKVCNKTSVTPQIITTDAIVSSKSATDAGNDLRELKDIGNKLVDLQDQVYIEKLKAHRRFHENDVPSTAVFSSKLKPVSKQKHTSNTEDSLSSAFEVSSLSQRSSITPKSDNYSVLSNQETVELQEDKQATFQKIMKKNNETRQQNQIKYEGAELFNLVKIADKLGYDTEEIKVAIDLEQSLSGTILWLKESWQPIVDDVVFFATQCGQNLDKNNVGELSEVEAKSALKTSRGNIDVAVKECVFTRRKLYEDVNGDNSFAHELVLEAMHQCLGNKGLIIDQLQHTQLKPFVDRIWQDTDIITLPINYSTSKMDRRNSISTSIIENETFQATIKNRNVDVERRIRMVLIEAKLKSWGRAETVIKIIDQEMVKAEFEMCNLEDVIEAVRNCGDFRSSLVYLQQECQICFGFFPMNKITSLNICPCKICLYCMKQHFAICVNDRNVRKWTCPVCALPNMGDPDVAQEYLSFLKLLVSNLCEQNIQDKFDKKATDWQIQQEPNFRWCAHCEFGFIFPGSPSRLCMKCDNCKNKTCFNCKKKWEDAHDGISCEEFEQWKIDNDPTNQALGLAKHLEENGIECPECKMRFALAKGGCMHFICPQCSYEFCSGCNKPFFHENCPERCKLGNGLHCHHPRDCFFYLRDEDCVFLQELLVLHEKKFNKDDINNLTTCPVMEQKETTTSNYDEACGKEVKEGWAGLCLIHYKEYLVGLVNKHSLDPLDVMKSEDAIKTICRRLGIAVEKKENEGRGAYIKRLKRNICEKEPLHGRIEKGSPPSVN